MDSSVLLVKLSSLGDVVHTFAAVTDFKRAQPHARLTWAVEEAYVPLVALNPHVDDIIAVPMRRLRQTTPRWLFSAEWQQFLQGFSQPHFSTTIDAQGLLKSAILSRKSTRSRVIGYDFRSAREPLASFFYQEKHHVKKNQHAVQRSRSLFSQAFQYDFCAEKVDFGLTPLSHRDKSNPYLLFFHGTTWKSKMLPLKTWQALKNLAISAGYDVFLPWGSVKEKAFAHAICGDSPQCHVLPSLDFAALGQWIGGSAGAISVDTGLGHLAGAFGVPVLGIFAATDPQRSGILGLKTTNIGLPSPCYKRNCRQHGQKSSNACMAQHQAADLWLHWQSLSIL